MTSRSEFKIDKKIPAPEVPAKAMKYPWRGMQVGDSIKFPTREDGLTAYAAARGYGKRHKMKFRIQKEGRGMRVWRIK